MTGLPHLVPHHVWYGKENGMTDRALESDPYLRITPKHDTDTHHTCDGGAVDINALSPRRLFFVFPPAHPTAGRGEDGGGEDCPALHRA